MSLPRIFLYGTLRRDARHPMHHHVARMARFIGMGHVPGKLLDLGPYPGAVPDPSGRSRVLGEVYENLPGQPLLPLLDRYEGCTPLDAMPHEFERRSVWIDLLSGERLRAWIYLYAGPLAHARRIPSGDYLSRQPGLRSTP